MKMNSGMSSPGSGLHGAAEPHQPYGQAQLEPAARLPHVAVDDLSDPAQALAEGVAVDEQRLGRAACVAMLLEVDLERPEQLAAAAGIRLLQPCERQFQRV